MLVWSERVVTRVVLVVELLSDYVGKWVNLSCVLVRACVYIF